MQGQGDPGKAEGAGQQSLGNTALCAHFHARAVPRAESAGDNDRQGAEGAQTQLCLKSAAGIAEQFPALLYLESLWIHKQNLLYKVTLHVQNCRAVGTTGPRLKAVPLQEFS